MNKKYKLAVLTSHPIQYQAPLFKKLARHPEIELMVYFCSDYGLKEEFDPGFGKKIKWDIPLLDGYKYKFLKNYSLRPRPGFFGLVNPSIVKELFSNHYDAILVRGYSSISNWFAFFGAWTSRTPVFLHGDSNLLKKPRLWAHLVKRLLFPLFFKGISAFLAVGASNKEYYKYFGAPDKKIFLTPYSIDNEFFRKESEKYKGRKEEIRKKFNLPLNIPIILYVGKIYKGKGAFDLLKAFEKLIITRNTRISPNMPNETKIIEKELSYKLNGIFFEIHNQLGRFARERQYADALEDKLKRNGIKYQREFAINVSGRKSNIADFIIDNKILVELKRKPVNTGEDYKQVMRYLESADLELGLLVNFGLEYLKPKRILNSKLYRNPKYTNSSEYTESNNKSSIIQTNSDYGAHLLFVGDGALRPELEKYAETIIQKNTRIYPSITNEKYNKHSANSDKFVNSDYGIHFMGFKNQSELPAFYAVSDVFVFPSKIDSWGLVVNEAMACGLPVIATGFAGASHDLIKQGFNGFVYRAGDIEELKLCLEKTIANPALRNKMGENSLKIISSWNYDSCVEGIIKALEYVSKQ